MCYFITSIQCYDVFLSFEGLAISILTLAISTRPVICEFNVNIPGKSRIHRWSEHFSKEPVQLGNRSELQARQDHGEDDEHVDDLPPDGFRLPKSIWLCQPAIVSAVCVSDDLAGEGAWCGGSGPAWLQGDCSCEASWMNCQIRVQIMMQAACGLEMKIQFTEDSSGRLSCMQHANCQSIKTCKIAAIALCDKIAHLRVAFYCNQPMHTWVKNILFNQHQDMPYSSGWQIILVRV